MLKIYSSSELVRLTGLWFRFRKHLAEPILLRYCKPGSWSIVGCRDHSNDASNCWIQMEPFTNMNMMHLTFLYCVHHMWVCRGGISGLEVESCSAMGSQPQWVRCCCEPESNELPSTTKVTRGSGIRFPDVLGATDYWPTWLPPLKRSCPILSDSFNSYPPRRGLRPKPVLLANNISHAKDANRTSNVHAFLFILWNNTCD